MHRPKESQKSLLESTMSPPTDFKDTNPNFPAEQSSNVCPTWLRRLCLGLAALHLLGVLAEPLRFFSRSELGVAPDFGWLGETAKPYSQWLYLDHGYFFFAPNPVVRFPEKRTSNTLSQMLPTVLAFSPTGNRIGLGCYTIAISCCPSFITVVTLPVR